MALSHVARSHEKGVQASGTTALNAAVGKTHVGGSCGWSTWVVRVGGWVDGGRRETRDSDFVFRRPF